MFRIIKYCITLHYIASFGEVWIFFVLICTRPFESYLPFPSPHSRLSLWMYDQPFPVGEFSVFYQTWTSWKYFELYQPYKRQFVNNFFSCLHWGHFKNLLRNVIYFCIIVTVRGRRNFFFGFRMIYEAEEDRNGEIHLLVLHVLLLVDNSEKVAGGPALLGARWGETSLQTGQRPGQMLEHVDVRWDRGIPFAR